MGIMTWGIPTTTNTLQEKFKYILIWRILILYTTSVYYKDVLQNTAKKCIALGTRPNIWVCHFKAHKKANYLLFYAGKDILSTKINQGVSCRKWSKPLKSLLIWLIKNYYQYLSKKKKKNSWHLVIPKTDILYRQKVAGIRSWAICVYSMETIINYLDFSNEFVVLFILRVWEFIDFYFVLLYLFHYLTKKESNQDERNTDNMSPYILLIKYSTIEK